MDLSSLAERSSIPDELVHCGEPDAQRECGVTLQQEGGIITCYRGVQYCQEDGSWGDCTEGEVTREPDPTSEEYADLAQPFSIDKALTSGAPAACAEVCDPRCMLFVQSTPTLGGSSSSSSSGPGCTHNVCTVSPAPLATSCGSCVASVCALDSSCCSGDWDGACVDLAYTACLNRLPPLGLCDFGVFAVNGMTTASRPSAGAAIGAGGDATIGTDASPSMIVVKGNLNIKSPNGKHVTTTGGVWVGGNVVGDNGAGAQYTGNWNVGGSINLNDGNTVIGTVRARSTIQKLTITGPAYTGAASFGSNVLGTGTRTTNSSHAAPVIEIPTSIPTRSVTCPGTTDKTIDKTTVTLAPGNYRDVILQNGSSATPSVLVLTPGGTYTFRNLTINSGCQYCKIQLGSSASVTGPWDVSVCGRALLEGPNSFIAGGNGAKLITPESFILYVGGTDPGAGQYAAKLGTDFKFVGVMMVPNGSFRSEDRGTVNGAVWAKAVSAGTDLGATQLSTTACEAALPATVPVISSCPITTTVAPPGTVDEVVYEATCPARTSARWKYLTWNTSVPASSYINFSARVGSSSADLAAKPYTLVGTSKLGTPNTTTCNAFGPSPACPVALTTQLGLGFNQGRFLSLKVEANNAGGASTVSDWKVTYTCQFSE
ncbi:MAG TPA: hypothetical protein VJU61_21870 [Polyangiaceae bacterium]|nr:hypothetical protein [Polyangiaceae bacterium]